MGWAGAAGCLVVGEVSQAHDGSLGTAHAFIDLIADAGADAVKFQTHIAAAESTPAEPWRVAFSPQDASRYAYWQRMGFTEEQWKGLRVHADERDLLFFSSPFSDDAVDLLTRVGVAGWKVPSGEVSNLALIERMARTGLPFMLSTGMSGLHEIDRAVDTIRTAGCDLTIMQCTSEYPTPPEHVGLNMIAALRERYGCGVGLSDHSGTPYAGLAAAALGADVIEVHVTLHPGAFGPDTIVSLTPERLADLVRGVRFIERARAHPVEKDALAETLGDVRRIFGRSIVARSRLDAGTTLQREHLAVKKPGGGFGPDALALLIGRTLARDVEQDQALREEDLS